MNIVGHEASAPVVTVVLTCYNDAARLSGIAACLMQSEFQDFELVVVDDGSTDGSADLIQACLPGLPRLRTEALPHNVGVARARNHGLRRATGRYVWFVDADDRFPASALGSLVDAAERSAADIVFGRAREVDPESNRSRLIDGLEVPSPLDIDEVCRSLARGGIRGFLWSKLFRRECIPDEAFPAVASQSDFLGLMRIIHRSSRFVAVPDVVYDYVRVPGSITARTDPLESLQACDRALTELCEAKQVVLSPTDRNFFTGFLVLLASVDTLLRAGLWSPDQQRRVKSELERVSFAAIAGYVRHGEARALRLALAKFSLPAYRAVYGLARRLRGRGTGRLLGFRTSRRS